MFRAWLLLPLCVAPAFAASDDDAWISIKTPSSVEAGVPFNATIDVEYHDPRQGTNYASAFRIYLGSSYRETSMHFYHDDCYLIHEQTLCDPNVDIESGFVALRNAPITVTIPPSVGPDSKYRLSGQFLNTDGSYYGASFESGLFEVTKTNGTWGTLQKQGRTLWGHDEIQCSGFSCVKDCADARASNIVESTDYQDCANKCPGVKLDPSYTHAGDATKTLSDPPTCTVSKNNNAPTGTRATKTLSVIDGMPTDVYGPVRSSTRTAAAAAATNEAVSNSNSYLRALYVSLLVAATTIIS